MRHANRIAVVALCCAALVSFLRNAVAHPVVPGFERFFTEDQSDAKQGGMLLFGELNCLSCHAPPQADTAKNNHGFTKRAPLLTNVTERVKPEFLRAFIADPHGAKPGTTMPNLFAGVTAPQRTEQVEALMHYLASLSGGEPEQAYANIGAAKRGDLLFHQVGCAACHDPRSEGAEHLPTSVPLPDLGKKYTLPSLASFLADPLHVRPSGRMPSLNLSAQEARDIAAFLLPDVPEKAGLAYYYYEGSWQTLPDFSKLTPTASGGAEKIDVAPAKRGEQFGLRFEGALPIATEGEYTFHLASDDGSRLWIDERLVVDNDGVHGVQGKSGKISLKPDTYHIRVDYFEQTGGEEVKAEWEGPGIARQEVAAAIVAAQPESDFPSLKLAVNPELVARGRELFKSLGCASCHEVTEGGQRVSPSRNDIAVSKLAPQKGCVSAAPGAGIPNFQLSPRQRAALSAAIDSAKQAPKPPGHEQQIASTMLRMNCYACHERGGIGGVDEARNAAFQGTQPEMGDEGRLPPHLNGTGDKLTDQWLANILANGADDRPYMHTRMPKFAEANAGHLAAAFVALDRKTLASKVEIPAKDARQAGWHMAGNKAFNCISCHTFGRFKSTGVQSIDLTIMTKRLREDWFKRYVRDPQAYRPGTRMPSSWPKTTGNKSLLTNVLDGDNEKQIQAMWAFLELGRRAQPPEGLVSDSMELIPAYEAIIYRNFIEGGGPRAIGVGYPEAVNLAFDANNLRLAEIWQGRFIDASRHWSGRGEGFQPPAGDKILRFADAPSFAVLENAEAAWPGQTAKELGQRFRGYRLSADQRPTFLYSVGANQVEDFPNGHEQATKPTLLRKITVRKTAAGDGQLFYRAAVAGKIEETGGGWYQVGDDLKMRIKLSGDAAPIVRQAGANMELICPVSFDRDAAEIVQEYAW